MNRPTDQLTKWADALDRAGGDGNSLRRARDLLAELPVKSGNAVTKRLKSIAPAPTASEKTCDPLIVSSHQALVAICAILDSVSRKPAWLEAYLDILSPRYATSWDELVVRFRGVRRPRAANRKNTGAKLSDQEVAMLAKELAAKLTEESWDLKGGASAFSMLDSPSITKPLAIAMSKEILGITHRSKTDAIHAIKNWYRHRRGAKASLEEIGSSSTAARTL